MRICRGMSTKRSGALPAHHPSTRIVIGTEIFEPKRPWTTRRRVVERIRRGQESHRRSLNDPMEPNSLHRRASVPCLNVFSRVSFHLFREFRRHRRALTLSYASSSVFRVSCSSFKPSANSASHSAAKAHEEYNHSQEFSDEFQNAFALRFSTKTKKLNYKENMLAAYLCTGCGKIFSPFSNSHKIVTRWDIKILFVARVSSQICVLLTEVSDRSSAASSSREKKGLERLQNKMSLF